MPFTTFHPAHHGFRFSNKFVNNVGIGPIDLKTKGRCGGMVYAALDFFHAQARVPLRVDLPPDGDPIADYIMARQVTSMVDMGPMFLAKFAQQVAPDIDIGPIDLGPGLSAEELFRTGIDYIDGAANAIDGGRPIALGLITLDFDPAGNHQVLAIGYEPHADRAQRRVHVYDPNHPGVITTLTPDVPGSRFIDNFGKSWRTLFNDTSYRASEPPRLSTPSAAAGFAITRVSDQLDVFWPGPDRAIGSTFWNPGSSWVRPFPITPPGAARARSTVSCTARTPSQLDAFWVGPDNAIGSTFWNGATNAGWHAPFPVTPPNAARGDSPVASTARLTQHLDVFWIGGDGAIASTFWSPFMNEGRWNQPFPVTPPGAAGGGSGLSAVTRLPHQLDLFWVGADGAIGSTFWSRDFNNGRWNPPFAITPPGAARAGSPMAAVTRLPHHIDVFWIGPDGAIGSTFWDKDMNGGRWHPPFPVTPPHAAGEGAGLTALARLEHHIDLFWVGPDGAIGSTFWSPHINGGRWNQPFPVTPPGAARAGSPVSVVARVPEHIDVFWVGPDGALGSTFWNSAINNGRWNAPFPITPPAAAG